MACERPDCPLKERVTALETAVTRAFPDGADSHGLYHKGLMVAAETRKRIVMSATEKVAVGVVWAALTGIGLLILEGIRTWISKQ